MITSTGPKPTRGSRRAPIPPAVARLLAFLLTMLSSLAGRALETTSEPRTQPLVLKSPSLNEGTAGPVDLEHIPPLTGFALEQYREYLYRKTHRSFFLPINAPALADTAPIEKVGAGYPAGLIDQLGEPYYTAYASLLAQKLVSPKRAQRIVQYRGEKQQLLAELRSQLENLNEAPARARPGPLAELSARQTPRLRELETEAEAIREDLTTTGLFKDIEDGTGLVDPSREFADEKEARLNNYLVLVSAAQFQNGFSLEQRQLLAEMATEEWIEANRDEGTPPAEAQMFFLPATSRIRLPAGLAPGLLAQIQVFREEKDRLKAELRAAVIRPPQFLFVSQRTQALAQLAAQQAPRIASLEDLAEEIRTGLANYPYPDEPPRSDLPPELTLRVGKALNQKTELQRKLTRRLRELRAELPGDRVEVSRQGESLALTVVAAGRNITADQRKARDQALATLPGFNDELRAGYTALAAEMGALRQDIQRYAAETPQNVATGVVQLVREFNQSFSTQQTWNRYRDYYRAVLQPGLSPQQRRLLYQGALVELRQSAPVSP